MPSRCFPWKDMTASVIENDRLDKSYRDFESRQTVMVAGMDEGGAAATRPHTGRRRNEAARAAILDATVDLLRAGGLNALTIDAVAQAAGVGRQTISRRWPSNGTMLVEAMGLQAA